MEFKLRDQVEMPVQEIWNNVIDATEFIVTAPVSNTELKRLSFPVGAGLWLSQPIVQLQNRYEHTNNHLLSSSVRDACAHSKLALLKVEPEDKEFDSPRYFVVFGLYPSLVSAKPSVAIRLDLDVPDWNDIQRHCGFSLPPAFVSFAENWPGLTVGNIDYPKFLLPPECWLDHKLLLAYDGDCQPVNPPELIQRLEEFLIFQCDYWGIARLLDAAGNVWEYELSSMNFTNTGDSFEAWLERELTRQIDNTRSET